MSIPGYTAETSLYRTKANYCLVGAHAPGAGVVVPQLSKACTECTGFFIGTRTCCDVEVLFCMPGVPCIVNFKNCHSENCGLLVSVGIVSA